MFKLSLRAISCRLLFHVPIEFQYWRAIGVYPVPQPARIYKTNRCPQCKYLNFLWMYTTSHHRKHKSFLFWIPFQLWNRSEDELEFHNSHSHRQNPTSVQHCRFSAVCEMHVVWLKFELCDTSHMSITKCDVSFEI